MKINIFRITIPVLFISLILSCTKNFEEYNTNPNGIRAVSPDQLLPAALLNSINTGMIRNRNFNNELMQVTVNISDAEGAVFRYDFRSTWSDYMWNNLYTELTNFKDMYQDTSSANNSSYKGISLICQAWIYSILTDTYGDIPFSESNRAKAAYGGIVEPKFDTQKDIYLGLFEMLEEANTLLSANEIINAGRDPIYNGDIAGWRKFGNSLYLRLLLRVSGKADVSAQAIAKIKEIAETNTVTYPIFANNSESARLLWNGIAPYSSPFSTIRVQDFRAPALCSFFLDYLITWSDPRFQTSTPYGSGSIGRLGISQASSGGFFGVQSGYLPGQGEAKGSYFQSSDNASTGSWSLQINPNTGIMMQYAEVEFILAEAVVKGWISGNAQTYFYQGMASAINYWVPSFPESITSSNFAEHLVNLGNGSVIWDDGLSLDEKMELVHLQKYYALFTTDYQQWFEYRRTGHPNLHLGDLHGLKNGGVMPARMVYPVYVQSTNPTNYKAAVAAQGADLISTNVWWQKP
ncbi:MAG: SusD/RagB family nutrient-binding outer membrane lipoprotein [Niabella sp.]